MFDLFVMWVLRPIGELVGAALLFVAIVVIAFAIALAANAIAELGERKRRR